MLNSSQQPSSLPAIKVNLSAIFVSLELSQSKWVITSLSPESGDKMSRFTVDAGNLTGLFSRFADLQKKAKDRTGEQFRIIALQEAGLDGFWIHRVLVDAGVESHVVDAASIAVSRRRRRVKTDRIDGEALVRALLAYKRGEPRVCAMVRVPTPDEEDNRRTSRERKVLTGERVRHVNRIKGLLVSQGVRDYEPLRRDRRSRLDELTTGDGRPLTPFLKAQISRELDRLELILVQVKECEAARDTLLARTSANQRQSTVSEEEPTTKPSVPAMLLELKGIGPETASILWLEGLSRSFSNRRQVAAYAGLAPSHWQSGSIDHDQGVSKAGNPRLRTALIQLSWLWLRHQPDSAISLWFKARVAAAGGRQKTKMIVAVARKLLVALWKYVNSGIVVEGAIVQRTI